MVPGAVGGVQPQGTDWDAIWRNIEAGANVGGELSNVVMSAPVGGKKWRKKVDRWNKKLEELYDRNRQLDEQFNKDLHSIAIQGLDLSDEKDRFIHGVDTAMKRLSEMQDKQNTIFEKRKQRKQGVADSMSDENFRARSFGGGL